LSVVRNIGEDRMKKLMIGLAALLAASSAYAAGDAGTTVSVNGWVTVGVANVTDSGEKPRTGNKDKSGFLVNDAEVIFNVESRLSNGMTATFTAELEVNDQNWGAPTAAGAAGATAYFDEVYTRLSGVFGAVELGENDGAASTMLASLAGCTYFTCAGLATGAAFDYRGDFSRAYREWEVGSGGDTGDALKVSYYSPSLSGFQLGASYAFSANNNGLVSGTADSLGYEIGARFKRDFGRFGVDVGAGYVLHKKESFSAVSDESSYGVTASISVASFTVGGAYDRRDIKTGKKDDASGFSVGVNYKSGPVLVGVNYIHEETPSDRASPASVLEKTSGLSFGVDYDLGSGVVVGATAEFREDVDYTAKGGGVFLGLSW
jgi:hypothetical protein